MKRLISLVLALLLLSGCGIIGERIKDPVTFYYIRADYQKDMGEVIVSEIREASGHRDDLPYLLALYSMGPASDDLQAPFPANIRILPTEHTDAGIVLSLSDTQENMTDAEYTLGSACLALTCMELTNASQITVVSGGRSITINRDNIVTFETAHQKQVEETK
ncbi:MAG: hypothetical protein U0N82_02145 [Oscillospiraceae bacterium]